MCGFGDDAVTLFDTNAPIAFSCGETHTHTHTQKKGRGSHVSHIETNEMSVQ